MNLPQQSQRRNDAALSVGFCQPDWFILSSHWNLQMSVTNAARQVEVCCSMSAKQTPETEEDREQETPDTKEERDQSGSLFSISHKLHTVSTSVWQNPAKCMRKHSLCTSGLQLREIEQCESNFVSAVEWGLHMRNAWMFPVRPPPEPDPAAIQRCSWPACSQVPRFHRVVIWWPLQNAHNARTTVTWLREDTQGNGDGSRLAGLTGKSGRGVGLLSGVLRDKQNKSEQRADERRRREIWRRQLDVTSQRDTNKDGRRPEDWTLR